MLFKPRNDPSVMALLGAFVLVLVLAASLAMAEEIVETTDGRRLRLADDGTYEWLAPPPAETTAGRETTASPTLGAFLAAPADYVGRPLSITVTLRLLGGRALASDPSAPGQGLAIDLDGVPGETRARVVRDCGLEGCRVVLTGVARRNARGPFLDAETLRDAQ